METDYLITRLKRVFDQCTRAQENGNETSVGGVIVDEFNDLLIDVKEQYPNNQIIQGISPVSLSGGYERPHPQDVEKVRMNLYSIADSIGIDMSEFKRSAERTGDMTIVNVSQKQSTQQTVVVENLIEQVNTMMMADGQKEELKEVITKFEKELNDEADPSRLKQLFNEAKGLSRDVALKLAMKGIENGVDLIS